MTAGGVLCNVVASTQRRGAEVFATDLSGELHRRGLESELVALTAGDEPDPLPLRVLGRSALAPSTLWALRAAARGAVIAHGSRTLPACAIAFAGGGAPFAYRSIGDPAAWSATGARRVRTALALRRAAIIVVLWSGAADVITSRHGIAAGRIRVIPNGVSAARCPAPSDATRLDARRRFGLPDDAPVVGYVGSLTWEKRVEQAIAAVGDTPGVHLVVGGHGPRRASLEALAQGRAPGRVRFTGALPDSSPVFAACDVVILASRTEGMPGALIEAGLCGRPVVAYAVGAVSEVVADGVTGLLVPSGDVAALSTALQRALEDPGSMGAEARRRCLDRFEIGIVGGRWAEVVKDLVAY